MIFPRFSREIGIADVKPYGDLVYFRTKYLVEKTKKGWRVLGVSTDSGGEIMHTPQEYTLLASEDECVMHEGKVNLYNTAFLYNTALASGKKCTLFRGLDNHMTFVIDPEPDFLLKVYVYDVTPPYANIWETIRKLEEDGVFGPLNVEFVNCTQDISELNADVYPCHAAGFDATIDKTKLTGSETVAGCESGRLLLSEMYKDNYNFKFINICPAERAMLENKGPFIAKCCQEYRLGPKSSANITGFIVGWGASPKSVIDAVYDVCERYRRKISAETNDASVNKD